jgi:hypothetical protein
MFRSRVRLGWALAVVVVLAAALMPAAGATTRGLKPSSPWYAYATGYAAALRNAQHLRRQHTITSIQPSSPWYAYATGYAAALRNAQRVG